jgi:AcrR family transcriptional regulator
MFTNYVARLPGSSSRKLDICDQVHTMSVNRRTRPRRTQEERRRHTRQALLDAALLQIEAGESFDSLSLRSVARAAGVVPAAFYRHFESMDELGLALVEESFRTLRAMLREAREDLQPQDLIRRSVEILMEHVREHRQHFLFVVRVSYTGNVVLRHAVRNEIRLLTSELATDLARFPGLREWTTGDLQTLASLFVNTMIATAGAMLDVPVAAPDAEAEIARNAEKQLRMIVLGTPHWRSGPRSRSSDQ